MAIAARPPSPGWSSGRPWQACRSHRPGTAFRTQTGRWSTAQRVTRATSFFDAQPRLRPGTGTGRGGDAEHRHRGGAGVAVACGRPDIASGACRASPATGDDVLFEPTLTSMLAAVVVRRDRRLRWRGERRRAAHGRRAAATVPRTAEMRLHRRRTEVRHDGAGRAVATWIGAPCSAGEVSTAWSWAGRLRDGLLSDPVLLDGLASRELGADGDVGRRRGGHWTQYRPGVPEGSVVTSRIEQDGAASSPAVAGDARAQSRRRRVARASWSVSCRPVRPPQGVGARGVDAGPSTSRRSSPRGCAVAAAPFSAAVAAAAPGEDGLRVERLAPLPVTGSGISGPRPGAA